ncbi:MAG: hypothetical protein ACR2LQ_00170 [Acidimicrobiales bacterium]
MDEERRSALLEVKLGALVRDAFGVTGGAPSPFPGGAALLAGGTLHVLLEGSTRSIGPAVALAQRHDATRVRLVVTEGAARLATQADAFAGPIEVFAALGTEVRLAEPEVTPRAAAPPDAPALVALVAGAGLDVVAEDGRFAGEVRGLEVARVTEPAPGSGAELEVGVGHADRELTSMLHSGLAPEAALARVVEVVDVLRRPGAEPHPLNRLVPERWLRWVVRGDPSLAGARALEPVPSPRPRAGLRDRDVACATATLLDDAPAVVVCSVGVDVDLVPLAAEARALYAPDAELILVVPARDVHRATTGLATALRHPARIVAVEGEWRTR